MKFYFLFLLEVFIYLPVSPSIGQTNNPFSKYNIYSGNTHAHTYHTWSHGSQHSKVPGKDRYMEITPENVSKSINTTLKENWKELQGPPSEHFALAKSSNYDFYVTTDHSQEAAFHPTSKDNEAWLSTIKAARDATDKNFIALNGYEHSENNGPDGKGHINVINSSEYLNALEPDIDLQYLYNWLKNVPANGDGPVVASFNHPGKGQYDNWAHRDPEITDIITLLEVINSNNKIHYQGFVEALDQGWKVSPVAGNDNHNLTGITEHTSRTFVISTKKTKPALLEAMKNRRTYAALDKNIQCIYSVNDKIMGSTLDRPRSFIFNILIQDPDSENPMNKITKIDIVKDGGEIVKTHKPDPSYSVQWNPEIEDDEASYFFVRVWNAGGGDASEADSKKPVAWLAPIWTGR